MQDLGSQKPLIEYPCPWGYKVIGPDEDVMRQAVKECLDVCLNQNSGDRDYELGMSRASKGGKYISLSLNLTVENEKERDAIFAALSGRPEILMVI